MWSGLSGDACRPAELKHALRHSVIALPAHDPGLEPDFTGRLCVLLQLPVFHTNSLAAAADGCCRM